MLLGDSAILMLFETKRFSSFTDLKPQSDSDIMLVSFLTVVLIHSMDKEVDFAVAWIVWISDVFWLKALIVSGPEKWLLTFWPQNLKY